MGIGNYEDVVYMVDEGVVYINDLFLFEDYVSKIDYSCIYYSWKFMFGIQWVYYIFDIYIVGIVMDEVLKVNVGIGVDIFIDLIVLDVFVLLNISLVLQVICCIYDLVVQFFIGWGLIFVVDDVVKLLIFFNVDDGKIDGQMLLDVDFFNGVMQCMSMDLGLIFKLNYCYNNGFWVKDMVVENICMNLIYILLMFGYGGIIVVMFLNDIIYYYFSDNDEFNYVFVVEEINVMSSYCQ